MGGVNKLIGAIKSWFPEFIVFFSKEKLENLVLIGEGKIFVRLK
jgi:hypothetical protein